MEKISFGAVHDHTSFVWCLLDLCFVKNSLDDAIALVSSIYEQNIEFPEELEELFLKLWETSDIKYVTEISKYVVWHHFFDVEKHVFIVAVLFDKNEININDAVLLLNYDMREKYAGIDERVKRVIDVVWLIVEDKKDGVMSPDEDNIFADALRDVLTLYR